METIYCWNCGRGVDARARYCPTCGTPLSAIPLVPEPRSVGVAYGLWALCILGVAGIHRFYAGRHLSGALWLLTWGLLGLGSLIDLFLIPGLIEDRNRRLMQTGFRS